ncbi:PMT family glycosyltransferase, 4-amino-4-deoxy-L-arabinose transferase [Desulfosporosinus acidiphilus SJ4]|uniref:PMT family glycosyltransferase, 4-amino-4-deoxy-L-arabinose transferase n=1 Tax=Desulfosporosinus acidiphilus (strain DSM 22704 / JCM 16185 / SJ4) TaxID=646529 RepID=I4D7J9_DESAJ|nr:glycosyltransferase family 39 protein [Desulfosporosinus acidiphilus]AFM41773.1 PMT family glycosyltransferase, 4-amino-4-deoxy-L-arabinose transferase [Desulfosporosinus acidiphilus SJ4]
MRLKEKRIDPVLMGIALLAAFLNIFNIWKDQYANAYYTAAVTSMLQSFHNFFFASFDPVGFVTVDKPPIAFWIQTLFASVFGVHGWSVVLPQALAGVGSVILVYVLVKPSFGRRAARITALVMACTPIAAAVSRSNNVDSLLVFTLLAATWLLFTGIRKSKALRVIGAFSLIGVAFNIKMLQAYMVLPAFYFFTWLAYKVDWKKKIKVLAAATAVMLTLTFSWALIVDSIPQADRPYIGSSQTNSVLELAFGYNGVSRLTGQGGPGGGGSNLKIFGDGQMRSQGQLNSMPEVEGTSSSQDSHWARPDGGNPPAGMGNGGPGGNRGGGGMFNTGTAGPLRLFQAQLSGQISWMLPFALLSAFGLLIGIRRRKPLTDKQKESLFWLAWLLPMMGFFSIAGFFHQYYLVMLAPAIAALTGTGWVELLGFSQNREGWKRWLLPVGILGTTAFQLYILVPYRESIGWGLPISLGVLGSLLTIYFALPLRKGDSQETPLQRNKVSAFLAKTAAFGGILVLLAGPLYWAATPLIYGDNAMMPAAGPQQTFRIGQGQNWNQDRSFNQDSSSTDQQAQNQRRDGASGQGAGPMQGNVNTQLLAYLETHNTGEKYLFATTNAGTAEAYIIQTGKAVMAMGGFSGSDPILTVDKLKQMVANKEVKYFLLSGGGPGRGSSDIQTWIQQNGTEIPQSEWQSNASSSGNSGGGMGMNGAGTLYEVNP